jgi:GH15 family glucan-1,4-alpha-glucosidase
MFVGVVALALGLAVVPSTVVDARTVDHVALANGVGAAALKLVDGRLDSFKPAIYQELDANVDVTPELLFDAYFAVQGQGFSHWLTEVPIDSIDVVDDAVAVHVVQHVVIQGASVRIETTWTSPHGLSRASVLAVVTATNESSSSAALTFPSIANFHMGTGGDFTTSESATYSPQHGNVPEAIVETGARGSIIAASLAPSTNHTMTPSDPFPLVENGQTLPTVDASGVTDNVVTSFSWSATLAPNASFTFGVLYVYANGDVSAAESDIASFVNARSASDVLQAETAASQAFVASSTIPLGLSGDERALFGHSLAYLRAAQVTTTGTALDDKPQGQIVASLPPGEWNITWVRDASYATEALLDANKLDEANASLRFFLDGDAGSFAQGYVGRDYLVSVVRYEGGGREQSDSNASGPNIEWDDFGLFLHAFAHAMDSGVSFSSTDIANVKSGVADVLLSLVDPATGLPVADSSIWETHWDPSSQSPGRRQYAYSSACASAGLRAFADALGSSDADAASYRATADALASAITSHLVDGNHVLAGNVAELQSGAGYIDAAAVEAAFNKDVISDSAIVNASLGAMSALKSPTTPGYYRNDDGGSYDSSEWLVVDLWLSRAFRRAGNVDEANRLLDHVTSVGVANLGQVPELLHTDASTGVVNTADGAIPMMGFGAGAYIEALFDRANDERLHAGEGEGAAGEGEGSSSGEGEGASSGEGEGAGPGSEGEGEGEGARSPPNPTTTKPSAIENACGCASSSSSAPVFVAFAVLASRRRTKRA